MNTLISAMVLFTLVQPAPQPVAPAPAVKPSTAVAPAPVASTPRQTRSAGVQNRDPRLATRIGVVGRRSSAPGLWEQACAKVLVVPTPELTDENLAQITEDMTVMCRILDKAVGVNLPTTGVGRGTMRTGDVVALSGLLRSTAPGADDESQTQGLYLGGHGALFFLQVNFPLHAPAQQPEPTPEGATTDPLWSQTVEELQSSSAANPAAPVAAQPYDAGRVENLQRILIASLRSAANMRLASGRDLITLVVNSPEERARAYVPVARYARRGTGPVTIQAAPADTAAPEGSANALIMRVSKADVDAFGKGGLTLGQFSEKVQILWAAAQRTPAHPAAPAQPFLVPQSR